MKSGFSNLFSTYANGKKTAFISALFTVVIILIGFNKGVSFEGAELNSLLIGEATLNDASVSKRVNFFFKMIGTGLFLLPFFYLLFSFYFRWLKPTSTQRHTLFLTGLAGLSIAVAQVIQIQSDLLLSFIFSIFLFILLVSVGSNRRKNLFFRTIDSPLLWIVFAQAFIVSFSFLYFLGEKFTFLPFFWGSVFLLFGVYFSLSYFLKISYRKITFLLFPIALFPALAFISVESVIYFSSKHLFFGYKRFFLSLISIVFFLFVLFVLFKPKSKLCSASSMFKYGFAPGVIIVLCLLGFYFPVTQQNTEIFEMGNPANALMRIFKHGEIPFVDFMSSHMFWEQWYSILYSFIFGYNDSLDFEAYKFFNIILYFLTIYFLLNKLFKSPLYSLLFLIVSFPFVFRVFSTHLIVCVLLFFILERAYRTQKTIGFFNLFVMLILLIVWRIDTGAAGLFAFLLYFPLSLLFTKTKTEYRKIFKAIGLFVGVMGVILGIAILLRNGNYIFYNFKAALHYIKANQAHGYSFTAHDYPHQFYIYHFIFSGLSVIAIVWITFLLIRDKYRETIHSSQLLIIKASLFFFILSLANGQRGLVRHGFAENNDQSIAATFFIACALIGIYFFKAKKIQHIQVIFYGLAFSLPVLLKFFPYEQDEKGLFDKAISENAFLRLNHDFVPNTPVIRTIKNEEFHQSKLNEFKKFVSENLNDRQTFLDFSNTPMLYYYTGKKVPGYFCQNLQNTVDDYLQFHLLKYVSPKSAPVVVFSSYPLSWFDATDGVPNVMRYYLISEYIYKYYKPYGVISEKSIWVSNYFQEKNKHNYPADDIFPAPKTFGYKHLSRLIHSFYEKNRFDGLEAAQKLEIKENSLAVFNQTDIAYPHSYLLISFKGMVKEGEQIVTLCDENNNEYDSFSFYTRENSNDYMIRISSSYHWHSGTIKAVKLKGELMPIESITLLKDKRCEH